MRLEFIHPIFLPPLTECFLRKDFNFSQYLAYAYGKTLTLFFNTSWVTLLLIMVFVESIKVLFLSTDMTESTLSRQMLSVLPPIFFLIAFLLLDLSFRRIERVLYPHVKQSNGAYLKPEEINFQDNYDTINPFTLYDNIPQPEYLEIDEGSADEQIKRFEANGKSPERMFYDQDDEESSMID